MSSDTEIRDGKGRTLAEFLAAYKPGNYPRPSLTADVAVFLQKEEGLSLLLIRRKNHPCIGEWALPGGFAQSGESVETSAARELEEETGLTGLKMAPFGFYSKPGRDPRTWVVSRAFAALIPPERAGEVKAGDDAADARWFDLTIEKEENGAAVHFAAPDCAFDLRFTLQITTLAPALQDVRVEIQENGGLAFDHGEMIGTALWRLGKI